MTRLTACFITLVSKATAPIPTVTLCNPENAWPGDHQTETGQGNLTALHSRHWPTCFQQWGTAVYMCTIRVLSASRQYKRPCKPDSMPVDPHCIVVFNARKTLLSSGGDLEQRPCTTDSQLKPQF
eukprot:scaffold4518_cov410-Prasinococcus_capsulatus_cf.AAC.39